jgi:hypothetical protein
MENRMKTTIGRYDVQTGTVPVIFDHAGVTHKRPVNAVLTEAGAYDRKGTEARMAEVAAGVASKIAAGVLTNPAPAAPEAD